MVVDLSMTEQERINLLNEVMQKIEPVLIRQVGLSSGGKLMETLTPTILRIGEPSMVIDQEALWEQ